MKKRKSERRNQFLEVLEQLQKIQMEIYNTSLNTILDETDLSLRNLQELQTKLQSLQKEKTHLLTGSDTSLEIAIEAIESGAVDDGIVETLAMKTVTWENERGVEFIYDGVRLLSMLEDYKILRQEKEEERKRQRDQNLKRLLSAKELLKHLFIKNARKNPRLPERISDQSFKSVKMGNDLEMVRKVSGKGQIP
ncbi:hypothetical protein L2E82_09102 [Cichorium intybus]|uniref:Uncharacterized protein n=1 Tax=Cichorium intybus TaxID=13427 RepID=A0ACB9G8H9_CICIN|nr:hypothetical protein L2E82_09102 [Cichorium intybus]